jgi:hypothetical protein
MPKKRKAKLLVQINNNRDYIEKMLRKYIASQMSIKDARRGPIAAKWE